MSTQVRAWKDGGEYAILMSDASVDNNGPDLVLNSRFRYALTASNRAHAIAKAAGLEYEIMREVNGTWTSSRGETAQQVMTRRWST
jgi:hypothetical protein